jgi:hypothetical protein
MSSVGTKPDDQLRLKGFDIEFQGAGAADAKAVDGSWIRCSGGVPTIEVVETTNQGTGLRTYSPGMSIVSDVVLEGFCTKTRKALKQWANDVFAGKESRADVTKVPKKIDGTDGTRDNYYSCLLIRYKFPTADVRSANPAREVITLKAMRHDQT